MNLIERLFGSEIVPHPNKRRDIQGNIDYCNECRTELKNAQPYNTGKLITSSEDEFLKQEIIARNFSSTDII